MNAHTWTGMVIRQHTEDGFIDLGRIINEDRAAGRYYWIPYPEKAKNDKRLKHHIKRPLAGYMSELEARFGAAHGQVMLVPFVPAGLQQYSEATLREMAADPSREDRRKLDRSLQVMDEQWGWIEPYVVGNSIEDLLNDAAVRAFARHQAQALKIRPKRIVRAIRIYLAGGMVKQALLPRWDRCNGANTPKLPRATKPGQSPKKAGRKNIAVRNGHSDKGGISLSEEVRQILRQGWRTHKKPGYSAKRAYELTMGQFFNVDVKDCEKGHRITLLPQSELPTIHQFRRHGPGRDPAMSTRRINLGEHRYARNERPLVGTARDGLMAACQKAYIDSTPEDQNLVSSVDPLVRMPQSYNTKVVEAYTGYLAGFYSSFERPSTLTSLAALFHAEQDKVDFCKRYGVDIDPDDWIAVSFRVVQGDNGEAKSEEGIHAMTGAEITAEFTQSYAAELKGPVESAHHVVASGAGHLVAGSSRGRRHERGDDNPAKDACQTHERYMNAAIRKILYHNNVEPVEHLLTLEMRREDVKPTRGAILKWLIKKGYVATSPSDATTLRTRCLPWLHGVIRRDGIRLYDPRSDKKRLIVHLRYSSEELLATGLTDIGKSTSKSCRVHVDPSHLGKAWLTYQGTIELELQTKDPELVNLTLREWLQITDSERLSRFMDEHGRLEILANDGRALYDSNKEARLLKLKAEREAKTASKTKQGPSDAKTSKREAGVAAIQQEQLRKLGLLDEPSQQPRPTANASPGPMRENVANDGNYLAAARKRAAMK
jgi:hypothetical protein